jgi:hypothetical protein
MLPPREMDGPGTAVVSRVLGRWRPSWVATADVDVDPWLAAAYSNESPAQSGGTGSVRPCGRRSAPVARGPRVPPFVGSAAGPSSIRGWRRVSSRQSRRSTSPRGSGDRIPELSESRLRQGDLTSRGSQWAAVSLRGEWRPRSCLRRRYCSHGQLLRVGLVNHDRGQLSGQRGIHQWVVVSQRGDHEPVDHGAADGGDVALSGRGAWHE